MAIAVVEVATRFGGRWRPRDRRGVRRTRRRVTVGGDGGGIDAPCWRVEPPVWSISIGHG
jgi:hypothetical protein